MYLQDFISILIITPTVSNLVTKKTSSNVIISYQVKYSFHSKTKSTLLG